MNVYVESNFVLELALRQAQSESCQTLVDYAANGRIALTIPAYSLAEPYDTIIRRRKERAQVKQEVDTALSQLQRTSSYSDEIGQLRNLTNLLISSANDEKRHLESAITRLVEVSEVIPLTPEIILASLKRQENFDFSPQDAFVYASVVSHLEESGSAGQHCFLNRDAKDFEDQNVVDELSNWGCKLLTNFDQGLDFVRSLAAPAPSEENE